MTRIKNDYSSTDRHSSHGAFSEKVTRRGIFDFGIKGQETESLHLEAKQYIGAGDKFLPSFLRSKKSGILL